MPQSNDIYIRILADLADLKRDLGSLKQTGEEVSSSFTKSWGGVQGQLAGVGLAINGLQTSLALVTAPLRAVLNTSAEFEFLQTRLTGLFGGIAGGERAFDKFNAVAARTPFSLKGVIEAGAQLKAFGGDSERLILSMADLAAFMGEDIVIAANSFGRAFAGGVGASEILRERGVLALVKSFSGIEDLTKLTLPQFRETLIRAIQDPAGMIAGSSDRLALTFRGAVSNMSDSLDRLLDKIGDEIRPALTGVVQDITGFLGGLEGAVSGVVLAVKVATVGLVGLGVAAGGTALFMTTTSTSIATLGIATTTTTTFLTRMRVVMDAITARAALMGAALNKALAINPVFAAVGAVAAVVTWISLMKDEAEAAAVPIKRLDVTLEEIAENALWENADEIAAKANKLARELRGLSGGSNGKWDTTPIFETADALKQLETASNFSSEALEDLGGFISAAANKATESAEKLKEARLILEEAEAKEGFATYKAFLDRRIQEEEARGGEGLVVAARLRVRLQELEKKHLEDMGKEAKEAREKAIKEDLAAFEEAQDRKADAEARRISRIEGLRAAELDSTRRALGFVEEAEGESLDKRLALLDTMAERVAGNEEALELIRQAYRKLREEDEEKGTEKRLADMERTGQLMVDIAAGVGEAIGSAITGETGGLRNALKGILLTLLDALKTQLVIAKAWVTAEGIFDWGAALKDLPKLLLAEAGFAVARTVISAFAKGGEVNGPTLGLVGEAGPEIIGPKKDFWQVIHEERARAWQDSTGDTRAHKLLQQLGGKVEQLADSVARMGSTVGREAGRGAALALSGSFK